VLEAEIDTAEGAARAVAVVCHPHPQQLGTMHNKVVTTLARTFVSFGAAAVRFNFRGVGASAGGYDGGNGERDDASAAVRFGRAQWPGVPLYLAGFSFGAGIAFAIAAEADPAALVTVAPSLARLPANFMLPHCPWLLVHGDADDVVPSRPVAEWASGVSAPPRIVLLEGVDHFFHGKLQVLAETVGAFLAEAVLSSTRPAVSGC
jgi:alpha/beta superfamily hydrolase